MGEEAGWGRERRGGGRCVVGIGSMDGLVGARVKIKTTKQATLIRVTRPKEKQLSAA